MDLAVTVQVYNGSCSIRVRIIEHNLEMPQILYEYVQNTIFAYLFAATVKQLKNLPFSGKDYSQK